MARWAKSPNTQPERHQRRREPETGRGVVYKGVWRRGEKGVLQEGEEQRRV